MKITSTDIYRRGRRLLDKYDLEDWRVKIDERPKHRRWGECRYEKKDVAVSQCFIDRVNSETIWITNSVWDDEYDPAAEIDNILVHEIAHAMKPGAHHYEEWKQQYADLLVKEMGRWTARRCLMECRYCRRHVDRLLPA